MQGQWLREQHYYRCRFPEQYAQANVLTHPRNIYLREDQLVVPLDEWLLSALAPPELEHTIETLHAEQEQPEPDPAYEIIADCDRKLANYRALVDAGTDPAVVTEWIKEVTARRIAAEARRRRPAAPRLTKPQIRDLIKGVGHVRQALRRADSAADKALLYQSLRLRMTYQPQQNSVRAEAELGPDAVGIECVSEGGLDHRNVAPLRIAGVHVKTVPRFNVSYVRRADPGVTTRAESESESTVGV